MVEHFKWIEKVNVKKLCACMQGLYWDHKFIFYFFVISMVPVNSSCHACIVSSYELTLIPDPQLFIFILFIVYY